MRFEGKRVLVTGAAHGIGLAIARAFVEAGARVALADVDREGLAAAVDDLGDAASMHPGDVRNAADVERTVAEAEARHGGLDVVVSNAGVYPSDPFLDLDEDAWDRVMDVNAKGCFLVCRAVARRMVAAGTPGAIVTIASGSARFAREGAAHYCASKAAVVALTRVMALELARHGIRANAVSPGLIDVPGGPQLSEGYTQAMTRMIPAGRMGRPEDVARAVLFVAHPDADYMTGEVVSIDGGLSAGRYGIPTSG